MTSEAPLLAAEAGAGPELLRLWEWPRPAVVLGSGCRLTDDVDEVNCEADGVPVLRRSSGGGTVLLGRGCLLFTLILDYRRSPRLEGIASSYGLHPRPHLRGPGGRRAGCRTGGDE